MENCITSHQKISNTAYRWTSSRTLDTTRVRLLQTASLMDSVLFQ